MSSTLETAPRRPAIADTQSKPTTPSASLVRTEEVQRPKEHGAYAMLGVPLATSWALGGITLAGMAISMAAFAGFWANEPFLILTGQRGSRAQKESPHAYRHWVILLALGITAGGFAFFLADLNTRFLLAGCALVASVGFVMSAFGKQRTLVAQLWSVIGLTLPSFAVQSTAELPFENALHMWVVWCIGQAVCIVAVRSVIASQRKSLQCTIPRVNDLIQCILTTLGIGLAILSPFPFVACLPMVVAASYLRLFPPSVRSIRRVGWSLVAANLTCAVMLMGLLWNR
ncbi:MAG: YwiC-like family protein [Pirellulales bacterium]